MGKLENLYTILNSWMLLHQLGSRNGRVLSLVDGRGRDNVVSELWVAALGLDGPS